MLSSSRFESLDPIVLVYSNKRKLSRNCFSLVYVLYRSSFIMLHNVSLITLSRFVDKNGNCYYSNENYQVAVRSKTIVRHIDFCFLEFCWRRPVNWPKFQIEVNFKLRRIPEKNIIFNSTFLWCCFWRSCLSAVVGALIGYLIQVLDESRGNSQTT